MPKAKQPIAKTAEELEVIRVQLVEQAKKDGHIGQKEIIAAIPETPDNAEILDKLYTELADAKH